MDGSGDPNAARKAWLSVLAKADAATVAALWAKAGYEPAHEVLRAPEIGAVMVRGRAGAVGAPFNLGEMTVTRCSVRLASGEVGHGYVQGRAKDHAVQAALTDALMQTAEAPSVEAAIVAPLRDAAEARRATRAAKAAATKVDFFTMVRGED
ncbi:phosphonate C-P lyase system protein PhnG [Tateyamaria omphalii]|uniref:Phosphonate C-P lyase system protein PhnG n=1 Tax=Tateyamaria omphalii TaxID=299262 RepID=A0A1P8MQG5_9RHOB|nr:phosphonate C-P lyase system protein PhnG [Tateyamaria omphalii]APX10310.1 phosphonate C-P lyase system protein PhnG [Tateyamaria omphalii]